MTLPSNIINTTTFRHFGNVIIVNIHQYPTILSLNIGPQCIQTKVVNETVPLVLKSEFLKKINFPFVHWITFYYFGNKSWKRLFLTKAIMASYHTDVPTNTFTSKTTEYRAEYIKRP